MAARGHHKLTATARAKVRRGRTTFTAPSARRRAPLFAQLLFFTNGPRNGIRTRTRTRHGLWPRPRYGLGHGLGHGLWKRRNRTSNCQAARQRDRHGQRRPRAALFAGVQRGASKCVAMPRPSIFFRALDTCIIMPCVAVFAHSRCCILLCVSLVRACAQTEGRQRRAQRKVAARRPSNG